MSLVGSDNLIQSYPAIPDSVPLARHAVTEFAARAGASSEQLEAIRLAASEALTNAVLHAYDGNAGMIHVNADRAGDELWLLVGDDGRGLQANHKSPGLGVGLALIARATDGLTIMNRGSGGTEVRMRFSLNSGNPRSAAHDEGLRRSASWPASSRFSTTR